MSDQQNEAECNALSRSEPSLPANWYYDPLHYAQEVKSIWQRTWLYVCHTDALAEPLTYRTLEIGDQSVVVLRSAEGELRAFHNSCRHRGSILCTERQGRLKSKLIVCPYHQWSYAVSDGHLARTSSFKEPEGFDKADYPLFPVAVTEWRGCIMINLDPAARWDMQQVFSYSPENLANYPLEDMVVGHTWRKVMNCNWKTFWENFNECLHCPNIHPELGKLVPLYTRRIMEPKDQPDWPQHQGSDDPKFRGGLAKGVETWSMDGSAQNHVIESLNDEDLSRGYSYGVSMPSVFIGAYADHVRIVRLLPIGPEQTELVAEWLFEKDTLNAADYDMSNVVDFAKLVMGQDSAASELNQRGMHAAPFKQGVLMPEEYEIKDMHDWIRAHLA
ncbi:MAG: aromatic ring-hydroxylating dioxygenase subunit alpha [Rhodospirillaceae bacterium]|nr:aromatic ring-hydroxylating dioxygenase subunit alpha [Rhodospirillaceae bacterium]